MKPIFSGDVISEVNTDIIDSPERRHQADSANIMSAYQIADINWKKSDPIAIYDVTLKPNSSIVNSRVAIKKFITDDMMSFTHAFILFHYDNEPSRPWRFSYVYKERSTSATLPVAKRYTYVFGLGFTGRTAAVQFNWLAGTQKSDKDFGKAFSVAAVNDEFFDKYRDIYADFVQYITGKRYEKIKNKWKEVKKEDPNTEIFSQFNNDDKRVRDYIKKMMGRLTFLCFLQRKGWMNNDRNFLQNLYQTSPFQADFLDAVLEPLFFGVLNTPPEKRKEVFAKNGWNTNLADEWDAIPYLNGGLFEQTQEDKLTVKFPKRLFQELFKFLGEYNFTIDENDPDDAEIGIDPEMLGRVFESLLEDNKDKGAFYTPKEIVQYMCRQSIIEYLKTHTDQSLHADIEDLINKGLINPNLEKSENAITIHRLLEKVTVCDPAIGSGAFPMGILNILFKARLHLYDYLNKSEPFNSLEVKKSIIRENIYGVDIEQGAVDIARLRFWLAILVEEQVAKPLPNLDYRIVRGNSLITTFNDEYIKLPENPDGRTKLAKLKKELHQLQNDLFDLNGDEKLQREIEIKCKILEILKVQLGIDKANAQEESRIKSDIFENKQLSGKALKKAQQARAIEEVKSKSLFALNNLITSLTTPATPLADRAQIDIKFFDWKIVFSNIFSEDTNASGFDIVIGNPPYGVSIKDSYRTNVVNNHGQVPDYEIYYYCIEVANNLLHNNGVLSYIIPNTYLFNTYATNYRLHILKDWAIVEILDCTKFPIFKSAMVRNTINLWRKEKNHNEVGYRNTTDIKSFDNLIVKPLLTITINDLMKLNQNWGLAFSLDNSVIKIVNSINSQTNRVSSFFDVSQGYIPYRLSDLVKEYGETKGNYICKHRTWHSPNKVADDYIQEINGRDITKYDYQVMGEFVKYGKHLACYVDMRFFNRDRIVVREITNPQIIACKIEGNVICVHDPQLIAVIERSGEFSLNLLWAILNSRLATFFHFNHSPKATKGAFPKILVQDIKDFPLPYIPPKIQKIIEERVNSILNHKRVTPQYDTIAQEKEIDIIVYHLYNLTYDEILIIDPQISISREEYESFNL
ncbi:MAG: Eco57I restriction-modification methylase domain-containing protein [Muribaculaceae bacterium]|nr:Eco57I restriction-modification methylase domain-containing protein [Muribaculaceae bacterium]